MSNIPNPAAAMAYTKALRDLVRFAEGAIETDDATLFLYASSAIDMISSPKGDHGQLVMRSILVGNEAGTMLAALTCDPPPALSEITDRLRDELVESLLAVMKRDGVA